MSPVRAGRSSDPAAGRWFWTLAILVGVGWLASSHQRMPDPVPANQPDTVFSSARAMSQLVEIARAPRPPGSPEHDRVRAYIVDRLRALGLGVEVPTETSVVVDSAVATSATVRNIVARHPGADPTGTIVLIAHYDGVPLSLGAGDDGIGIASILETIRAVRAGGPLRNDLIVTITDGQELGSLGARALLDRPTWADDLDLALSVDVRGVSGPALLVESTAANGALVRAVDRADPSPAAYSVLRAVDPPTLDGSDLAIFAERGVPGLGFSSFGGRHAHHGAADRPINVSEATLQHHGVQLLALTRALGNADLSAESTLGAPSRMYATVPFVGVVDYPDGWSTLATVGIVLAFALLVLLFRVRGGDLRRVLAGFAVGVGIVGGSAAAGWGLLELLSGLHPETGRVGGATYEDGLHTVALAALVVALATSVYALARRWLDPREVLLGALLLPLFLIGWASLSEPFALTALQPPTAVALLAGAALVVMPRRLLSGRWGWLGMLAAAAAVLMVAVPAVEVLAAALTLRAAPTVAAAMAIGLLFVSPTFEWLIRPKAWWTPALATIVATVAVVMGTPAVQGDAAHPVPTSLIHLVDDALPVSAGLRASPTDAELRWMPGRWLTVPGVGQEWAMSWVVGPAAGGPSAGPLLLPREDLWIVAGTGAEAELARPAVRVVEDELDGGRRRLRLALGAGLGGEMVGVRLVAGAPGEWTAVNGRSLGAVPGSSPIRALTHWGRPESGAVTVDLLVDVEATAVAFDLVEHHLRPAELLGANFFQREDSVVADASTGSDRVIQRVRVDLTLS